MSGNHSVHIPVLLHESITALCLKPGMTVVDATLGGGGYSKLILDQIGENSVLVSIDQDCIAVERFKKNNVAHDGCTVHSVCDNFAYLQEILKKRDIEKVDAIVADLGLSSDQLTEATRGFSFQKAGPLDMRMNTQQELTAALIVNNYSEEDIAHLLFTFGDERYSRRIAKAICRERLLHKIMDTKFLADLIFRSVPVQYRYKSIHPATRTFQALRIVVNNEYHVLKDFLVSAVEVLRTGGLLSVVTFHSGEDRIVKNFFRENTRGCVCPKEFPVCICHVQSRLHLVTRKPILPTKEEIAVNPRARSAKLRVVQKL